MQHLGTRDRRRYPRQAQALTFWAAVGKGLRTRAAHIWDVGYRIFWLGDMTTIRGQLAIASLFFAGLLWLQPDAFDRRGFSQMVYAANSLWIGREMGAVNFWAWLFVGHGALALWRLWDQTPRPYWLLFVNSWGFLVWFVSTALINLAVGEVSPGTAIEITILLNAFAALARTGLNDDKVSP